MRASFFSDPSEDAYLEEDNNVFWRALLEHVEGDLQGDSPKTILDVGCHHGGLLARLGEKFPRSRLFGVEPIEQARDKAAARLHEAGLEGRIIGPEEWLSIPANGIDLIVCHEVLYLVPDIALLMGQFRRALASGGAAYVVAGCHTENPIWKTWSERLMAKEGLSVHGHSPIDIMGAGARCGLTPSVRPLRRDGWVNYDPSRAKFVFPNVGSMLDHHYRHKLVFRFLR